MDLKIRNKVALITGSTQGIGYATARMLAAEGAHVIVNGRRTDLVKRAVSRLGEISPNIHGIDADLSSAEGARKVIAVAKAIGPIDILVNNVGYFEVKPFTAI